jgi:hypothetical protein
MGKLVMHWQVQRDGDSGGDGEAEFFLYRDGEEVHCDHRQYSREELNRRMGAMQASVGEVPVYYQLAAEALDDPEAAPAGSVDLDATR